MKVCCGKSSTNKLLKKITKQIIHTQIFNYHIATYIIYIAQVQHHQRVNQAT